MCYFTKLFPEPKPSILGICFKNYCDFVKYILKTKHIFKYKLNTNGLFKMAYGFFFKENICYLFHFTYYSYF